MKNLMKKEYILRGAIDSPIGVRTALCSGII